MNWNIALQWGGFGIIAFFFYLGMRRDWKRQDDERADIKDLKKDNAKAVTAFIETANDFNATVQNHLVHEQESFEKLAEAIERLCRMWDNK